jgi:AcrR family transcriptional regulator
VPAGDTSTRERDLVQATRRLWDERGMQDAPVEEIARAVGIARGLIYRRFRSKAELQVLTITDYLDELQDELVRVGGGIEGLMRAFAGFCCRYPAFLDASMSLMRRPAAELQGEVSESVWLRLGAAMAAPLGLVADVLAEQGAEDPELLANLLWTQTLGAMHLTRIGVGVGRGPALFAVDEDVVIERCVRLALAAVRG